MQSIMRLAGSVRRVGRCHPSYRLYARRLAYSLWLICFQTMAQNGVRTEAVIHQSLPGAPRGLPPGALTHLTYIVTWCPYIFLFFFRLGAAIPSSRLGDGDAE